MILRAVLLVLLSAPFALACRVSPIATADFPNSVVVDQTAQAGIVTAWFDGATGRYPHGILGDTIEAGVLGAMSAENTAACGWQVKLGEDYVFEDVAPRLADIDGDGRNEIIVVRSHAKLGAQLAIYGETADGALALQATTPAIGRKNRWLAPIGIADFDRDGRMDVAYIEKPHLDKVLKVYSWEGDHLKLIAKARGLSNHRIGDETITSGLRDCGRGVEIITPNASWTRVYAGKFAGGRLVLEELGPFQGETHFADYLTCDR